MSKKTILKSKGENKAALDILQGYSLAGKIAHSQRKIKEWHDAFNGEVYVSFSGGKDSTVLLYLAREMYPDIKAVFCDTGLEYPEIRDFVKTIDNVEWLKPKMTFNKVIEHYGYPIISKEQSCYIDQYLHTKNEKLKSVRFNGKEGYRNKSVGKISEKWKYLLDAPFKISDRCCYVLKKNPFKSYETKSKQKPMIGTMACESAIRRMNYHRNGCNGFSLKRPVSTPIIFWNEDDIWQYIKVFNVPYSDIYNMGYDRTGCMFCLFGYHMDTKRLDLMKVTHPKQYDYCMNKLGMNEVLKWYPVKDTLTEGDI